MRKLQSASLTLLVAMVLSTSACGSGDPTQEEKAAAALRLEANLEQVRLEQLADFPALAPPMIARLETATARDVSDMDAAVGMIRLFDEAAMNIGVVEHAVAEGASPVPDQAIAAKERLKRVLTRKQRELFPAMRQTYAAYLSNALSGTQANFRAVGARSKTLRGASPSFGTRDTVMQSHQTVMVQATRFRFTRAEYVYSITGDFDYFSIHGRADEDLDL